MHAVARHTRRSSVHTDTQVRRFAYLESERGQLTGTNPPPPACGVAGHPGQLNPHLWGFSCFVFGHGQRVDYVSITVTIIECGEQAGVLYNTLLSWARTKTVVLTLGSTLPALIYPLAFLSSTG